MNSLAKYGLIFLIIISCDKDEIILPVLKTNEASNVFYNSAKVSTELIEPGSDLYYRIGFVWNTNPDLDLELKTVTKDSGDIPAVYEKTLCNLDPGTKYYYAPFVRAGDQIVWAETKSFTTPMKDQSIISVRLLEPHHILQMPRAGLLVSVIASLYYNTLIFWLVRVIGVTHKGNTSYRFQLVWMSLFRLLHNMF